MSDSESVYQSLPPAYKTLYEKLNPEDQDLLEEACADFYQEGFRSGKLAGLIAERAERP